MSANTEHRNRQPKGHPTGGQYASEQRASSGLRLGGDESAVEDDVVDAAIEVLRKEEEVYPFTITDRTGLIDYLQGEHPDEMKEAIAKAQLDSAPRFLPENPTWRPADGVPRGDAMYSRSYGGKSLGQDMHSIAQVNKGIRADIKEAQDGGYLPDDLTYRVIKNSAQSISITATGLSVRDYFDRRDSGRFGELQPSPFVREVDKRLEAIAGQYNWNGSDSQIDYFDVNFYSSVRVESPVDAAVGRARRAKTPQDRAEAIEAYNQACEEAEQIAGDIGAEYQRPYRFRT